MEALKEVDESVIPWFRGAAKQLLEEMANPEVALARALAKITGHTQLHVCALTYSFNLDWALSGRDFTVSAVVRGQVAECRASMWRV